MGGIGFEALRSTCLKPEPDGYALQAAQIDAVRAQLDRRFWLVVGISNLQLEGSVCAPPERSD